MKKKWYLATLILRCRVGNQEIGPWTCQEQIRLLKATNHDEAYMRTSQLGKDEEHSYINVNGEPVFWEFIGIEDLEEISAPRISDGIEIRSRLWKENNPLKFIREKSDLTIYRSERNKSRTAREILLEDSTSE